MKKSVHIVYNFSEFHGPNLGVSVIHESVLYTNNNIKQIKDTHKAIYLPVWVKVTFLIKILKETTKPQLIELLLF